MQTIIMFSLHHFVTNSPSIILYCYFNHYFLLGQQRIPKWWRWYYWGNPLAWTIYGMVGSQFGDYDDVMVNGETVKGFMDRYFGIKHDFLGVVAGVHIGLVIAFGCMFAFSIKAFNFQKR